MFILARFGGGPRPYVCDRGNQRHIKCSNTGLMNCISSDKISPLSAQSDEVRAGVSNLLRPDRLARHLVINEDDSLSAKRPHCVFV